MPVAFDLVPGGLHDLTPIHELTYGLPEGAAVYADKAYYYSDTLTFVLGSCPPMVVW